MILLFLSGCVVVALLAVVVVALVWTFHLDQDAEADYWRSVFEDSGTDPED